MNICDLRNTDESYKSELDLSQIKLIQDMTWIRIMNEIYLSSPKKCTTSEVGVLMSRHLCIYRYVLIEPRLSDGDQAAFVFTAFNHASANLQSCSIVYPHP